MPCRLWLHGRNHTNPSFSSLLSQDTPAHDGASVAYREARKNCGAKARLNTCPDNIPGVDPGPDPVTNWMNYLAPSK